jgi:hypothetical protein
VRKSHQKGTRLKRLFKLCSLLIGSYNITIVPRITNIIIISYVIYFRPRSMMNLLLRIITNVVLELLFYLKFITIWRVRIKVLRIKILRNLVRSLSASAIGEGTSNLLRWCKMMLLLTKEEVSNARHADAITIQLISAPPSPRSFSGIIPEILRKAEASCWVGIWSSLHNSI